MPDGVLVLVVWFCKGDAGVCKQSISVCALFTLGGGNSLEERRVSYKDNFASRHFQKIWDWGSKKTHVICFQDEMLMKLDKPFSPQPLAECGEVVVRRDHVTADTEGLAIDSGFGQFLAGFSIR